MNLLFLVEGGTTEYQVYSKWISHLFPHLKLVARPEDMITDSYQIIAGHGYPNILRNTLEGCLQDVKRYNNVDHFFICIDSEEDTYQVRFDEIEERLSSLKNKVDMRQEQSTNFHVVVQNCCIETWFLGNAEIPTQSNKKNSSTKFLDFQSHYDILVDDPELMIGLPPKSSYRTKASFHKAYLNEYLRGFGLRYIQSNPKMVEEKEYLDALIKRCKMTNHLSSFKYLLEIWQELVRSI